MAHSRQAGGIWPLLNPGSRFDIVRRANEREVQEALRKHVCVETSLHRYLLSGFLGSSRESCDHRQLALSQ